MAYFKNTSIKSATTNTGVSANVASLSTSVDCNDCRNATFWIEGISGTHTTHVYTVQYSPDETYWVDSATTITGVGVVTFDCTNFRYIRVKCTTSEGAASTVDITAEIYY